MARLTVVKGHIAVGLWGQKPGRFFCAAQPDNEVVSAQFGMDFMNHPFKPI